MEIPEIALTIANNLESPVIFPSNCHSGAVSRQNCRFVPTPPWGGGIPLILLRFCGSLTCTWCHRFTVFTMKGSVTRLPNRLSGPSPKGGEGRLVACREEVSPVQVYTHLCVAAPPKRFERVSSLPRGRQVSLFSRQSSTEGGPDLPSGHARLIESRETRRDSLLRSSAKNIPFLPFSLSSLFRRL